MSSHKQSTQEKFIQDRLSYLWLGLGILLLPFGTARWTIPLAAWLYPIFLLRFVRTQSLRRSFLLTLLATTLVLEVAWIGFLPMPEVITAGLVVGLGVLYTLPYLIDRILAPRLGGLLGTLVFPLATTTVWYLFILVSPWGAMYNPANTQYGNLPLLQLLSVTGLWGIVILMSWLASVVNWVWERGFAWPQVRGGLALYAGLLALVLLFGGARLALFPAQGSAVRVAGISPSQLVTAAADQQFSQMSQSAGQALMSGTATQAERETYGQASARVFADSLALSEQEARAGAKIVVWPEYNGGSYAVLEEDEEGLLAQASTVARTTGIYLNLDLGVILQQPVQGYAVRDESILIDPTGAIGWRYEKSHPVVPGSEAALVPGDGRLPTIQTPYGQLSTAVCFDAAFPGTLRQAGQAGVDIMLNPSNDWQEVGAYPTQLISFRAIENGFSLVRPTSHGLGMAVDYEGHVLAASDYYTSDPQVIVASIPMRGVRTIYATIGDLFAWLSMAALVVIIAVALVRRSKVRETSAASLPIS